MAKKTTTITIATILLVGLVVGLLFYQPTIASSSGGGDPNSSPSACPAGQFLTQVAEASGVLSLTCLAGGGGDALSTCGTNNQFATGESSAGALGCSFLNAPVFYVVSGNSTLDVANPMVKGLTRITGTDVGAIINTAVNNILAFPSLFGGNIYVQASTNTTDVYLMKTAINMKGSVGLESDGGISSVGAEIQVKGLAGTIISGGAYMRGLSFIDSTTGLIIAESQACDLIDNSFTGGANAPNIQLSLGCVVVGQWGGSIELFTSGSGIQIIVTGWTNGATLQLDSGTTNNLVSGSWTTTVDNSGQTNNILINSKNPGSANGCPAGQYVTKWNSPVTCSNVPNTVQTCTASCTLNSVTEAVDANSASALTLTLPTALVVSYHVEDVGAGTASVCPPAGPTLFIGGKSYTSTSCFSLPQSYQLSLWSDGTNWFGIATQIQWSQLTGFPAACLPNQFVNGIANPPVCASPVNMFTQQHTRSCSISSVAIEMASFKMNYTTQGSNFLHTIDVRMDFQITAPSTNGITSGWAMRYGTGSAPTCGLADKGTPAGAFYETSSFSNAGNSIAGSEVAIITGLSPSTTYWFDLAIHDSTTGTWTYSNPEITVIEQ